MPLPNKDNLDTLDYAFKGAPFVQVEAKPLGTTSLNYAYKAQPFVGASASAGIQLYVKVSGAWVQATAAYVNVGGSWKTVTSLATNVSGSWKTA